MFFSFANLLALAPIFGLVSGDTAGSDASYHKGDVSYHDTMWVLGSNGVYIFNVDGSEKLNHLNADDMCPLNNGDTPVNECGFREVVSDGERNVWATDSSDDTLKVFNIENGMLAASLPTCHFPSDLDYSPLRQELWVHCWSPKEEQGDSGHLDVFSTSAITTNFAQVALGGLANAGHGNVVLDSTMPNTAYASTLSKDKLFEIDLNTMSVKKKYTIPLVSGVFRMMYSHNNKHLFIRAYVCCSCGFTGSDLGEKCGGQGNGLGSGLEGNEGQTNVDVVTGPNQATNVKGQCGHPCEGSPADSIGVYEFDTVSKKIIAQHNSASKNGCNPFVSRDGVYTFLLGNDGGDKIDVLMSRGNGTPSYRMATINTGFQAGGDTHDGDVGASDIVFIEELNIAIIASTVANFIVVVQLKDIQQRTFNNKDDMDKIWLEQDEFKDSTSEHGKGARRDCVYAGMNYLWCNASKENKVQIIQLVPNNYSESRVVRNINNVPSDLLVYVTNKNRRIVENQIVEYNNVNDFSENQVRQITQKFKELFCGAKKDKDMKKAIKSKVKCNSKSSGNCNAQFKKKKKKIKKEFKNCVNKEYV